MRRLLAISVAVLLMGFFAWTLWQQTVGDLSISKNSELLPRTANQTTDDYQIQENQEGSVTVKVKPKTIAAGYPLEFEITLDTHSGSLDQDLTKISILINDKEEEFNPIAWEGDPQGGHHRKGILKFKPTPTPKSIELRLNNIGDVDERVFSWDLE